MDTFNPISDMPRTKEEALRVLAQWGSGSMTFTHDRAERCYQLLSGNIPEFKREERYLVIKIKDVFSPANYAALLDTLQRLKIPTRAAVVVEADWPEYEPVWKMIEQRMLGGTKPNFSGTNSGRPGAVHAGPR